MIKGSMSNTFDNNNTFPFQKHFFHSVMETDCISYIYHTFNCIGLKCVFILITITFPLAAI